MKSHPILVLALVSASCSAGVESLGSPEPDAGAPIDLDAGPPDAGQVERDAWIDVDIGPIPEPPSFLGIVAPSCAPTDGPAWAFLFSQSPVQCTGGSSEGLMLSLWKLDLSVGSFTIADDFNHDGQATLNGAVGGINATGGTIGLELVDGQHAAGWFDLQFPNNLSMRGHFSVQICPGQRTCG